MAFGSWTGREGSRSDDPWNRAEPSINRETQCRHEPEPELKGSRLQRRRPRGNKTAAIIIIVVTFIMLITIGVVSAFYSMIDSFSQAVVAPVPELPFYGEFTPDDYEDMQEYFEQFFQSGSGSGVNYLERTDAPGIELSLVSGEGSELSIQDIYDKCSPSIVGITSQMENGYGWGTGVIMTEDGYIITNSHVLDDATEATVTLHNDEEYPAKLVGYDSFSDIAIIKIDCAGLVPAQFGDSSALRVGDDVVAIGNPLGIELRGTMTDGIVSAINREVNMDGHMMTLIQTNAQINGGNSGGALIDMQGRVIGITNMKMMSLGTSVEGLGFAIPTGTVKTIADEILLKGFVEGRPGIGITCVGIGAIEENGVKSPAGVYVDEVTPNSGADRAGIKPGDIITHADGVEVYSTADLNTAKGDKGVGDYIHFTVWREGSTFETDVEIMDMNSLFN